MGVGNSSSGRLKAKTIKGIPKKEGLSNWSKKFTTMVTVMSEAWMLLWPQGLVRSGIYGLKLSVGGWLERLVMRKIGW